MPLSSANTFSLSTVQNVFIDCSAIANDQPVTQQLSQLIGWVQTVPKRSSIHVTLRFATAKPVGRKIKTVFQSLGCTVTMKTAF